MIFLLHGCRTETVSPETEAKHEITGWAVFSDGVTLNWQELQNPDNGEKYGFNADVQQKKIEVFAMSVQLYFENPEELLHISPQIYACIQEKGFDLTSE